MGEMHRQLSCGDRARGDRRGAGTGHAHLPPSHAASSQRLQPADPPGGNIGVWRNDWERGAFVCDARRSCVEVNEEHVQARGGEGGGSS